MKLLPRSIRNLLARKKPAPRPRCDAAGLASAGIRADCIARSLPENRNTPETVRETWINDNAPDQVARKGEGQ